MKELSETLLNEEPSLSLCSQLYGVTWWTKVDKVRRSKEEETEVAMEMDTITDDREGKNSSSSTLLNPL